jgi:hypothetical protein
VISLICYQFDRVITEKRRRRRRLFGIVQGLIYFELYFDMILFFYSIIGYVYKLLYSEVFNQPKVVEQAKAMLRKSDILYYGVQSAST